MKNLTSEERSDMWSIATSIIGIVGSIVVGKILLNQYKNTTRESAVNSSRNCSVCGRRMTPINTGGYECPEFTSFANEDHTGFLGGMLDAFGFERSLSGYEHDSDRKDSFGGIAKYCAP